MQSWDSSLKLWKWGAEWRKGPYAPERLQAPAARHCPQLGIVNGASPQPWAAAAVHSDSFEPLLWPSYSFVFLQGQCPGTFLLFSLYFACKSLLESWMSCFPLLQVLSFSFGGIISPNFIRRGRECVCWGMGVGMPVGFPSTGTVALVSFHSVSLTYKYLMSELQSKLDLGNYPID